MYPTGQFTGNYTAHWNSGATNDSYGNLVMNIIVRKQRSKTEPFGLFRL